ncbi:MAG: PIN domain-containing protein [Promethearchaeia archaeon]
MKIGIDTNIFLNVKNKEKPFFKFSKKILDAIDQGKLDAVVSVVIIAELTVKYYQEGQIKEKEEFISTLYANSHYEIINLDLSIADKTGKLRSRVNLKLPDCIIIASCLQNEASCLITNDGDFKDANGIFPVYSSDEFVGEFL